MSQLFDVDPKIKTNENNYNIEETIESTILTKVKKFYDLHKILKYNHLNDFLDSVSLSDVFATDDEKEIIWMIFTDLSGGSNEIDYETCKKGIIELFAFYVGGFDKNEAKDEEMYNDSNNSSKRTTLINRISDIRNKNHFMRESVHSKGKNIDELLARISLRKTLDNIPNNSPLFLDAKLNDSKHSNQISISNNDRLSNRTSCSVSPNKKFNNEKKITKIFTEIDIDKLQQLRKIFSLLDLRNKEHVYISEVQEVINKYQFINLTEDELINFLSLISDDLIQGPNSKGNAVKLSINFELYSKVICIMERQLLQINADTFSERNESYEINENYSEMIEDLHKTELESIDYVMLLADILKSIEYQVNETITENYEKIINKEFDKREEEKLRDQIKEGIVYFKNKLKDMEMFLKEMNTLFTKKQNKLTYFKMLVNKLEENLKNAEEDYRSLFQKFNMSQPVEIDEETEKLIEENNYLSEQKQLKDDQIDKLQRELDDKEEQIFNFESNANKLIADQKHLESSYNLMKNDYEIIKKNYDVLINDIYDKILKQEELQFNKKEEKSKNDKNVQNSIDKELLIKLREKLIISEDNKKIFDMNYEQLITYTLNVELLNKQLEEKNSFNEKKIKELEREINSLTKNSTDNSKSIHMLKSENMRLQNKINELNKDVEMNHMFRPSKVLGNRISRISKMSEDRKSISGRFKNMQKLFEVDNPTNTGNETQDKQTEIRISKMEVDEVDPPFNSGSRKQTKLTQVDNGENFYFTNNKSNIDLTNRDTNLFEFNSQNMSLEVINNSKFEPNYTISILSRNESINEKLLFDEKETDKLEEPSISLDNFYDNDNESFFGNNKNVNNRITSIESSSYKPKEKEIKNHLQEDDRNTDNMFELKNDKNINLDSNQKPSPFDSKLETKENNKQVISNNNRNQITNTTNQTTLGNKKFTKIPSQITEEILEEDANGDIIGTGVSEDASMKIKNSANNLSGFSSPEDAKKKSGLKRQDTYEDLATVFNKDSQYICYDFLTLRKTEAVLKMFEDNREDVSSYEMFSDNIYLIDENNKKGKKYLFITSNYIYILRPYDLSQKTRINLKNLDKITISNKNCNLIAFHFTEGNDLLLEILRRMELLYYFRDLYRMKQYGKLKFKYSDNFKIKRNNAYSNIIVDQANNFFIAPNFEGAQKLGYLSKLAGGFFTKFNEKLVVLTNVGLLYFDDPNKPPKKLIPVVGSDIQKIDEKRYKKKHCLEIKTLNGESYVFATKSAEELESWILEFKNFKKNYEKKMKNLDNKK